MNEKLQELSDLLAKCKQIAESFDTDYITSPDRIAALVMADMAGLVQEEFWTVILNTRNSVIGIEKLYKGNLSASSVRIAEVFRRPIIESAAAVIVVHNHPSGDPKPSPEDVVLTKSIVEAGKILDIEVLDHIVIGKGRYASLKGANLM